MSDFYVGNKCNVLHREALLCLEVLEQFWLRDPRPSKRFHLRLESEFANLFDFKTNLPGFHLRVRICKLV